MTQGSHAVEGESENTKPGSDPHFGMTYFLVHAHVTVLLVSQS